MKLYTRPRLFPVGMLATGDQVAVDTSLTMIGDYERYVDLELDDAILWAAVHDAGHLSVGEKYLSTVDPTQQMCKITHSHRAEHHPPGHPVIWRTFVELDPWSYIRQH